MSLGNCMKYAWRMNQSKGALVVLFILTLAVSRLLEGVGGYYALRGEMSEEVNLYCTITGADSQYISQVRSLEGVRYVTEYRESRQTLRYNGYSIQIKLVGCESAYLEERYSEDISTSMEGSMPYIILSASVLNAMTNEKGEKMEAGMPEDFLLDNFEVDSERARLSGILEETSSKSDENNVYCVYTTLNGYEALTNAAGSESDNGVSANTEGSELDNESPGNYLVVLKNGFYLNSIVKILSGNGIAYTYGDDSDLQLLWNDQTEKWQQLLEISGVMLLAALLTAYYQWQLWCINHRVFLEYISQFDHHQTTVRSLMACRILWLVMISIPCGGLLFLMRTQI